MHLKKLGMAVCITVGALALALPALCEGTNGSGQGHAIVTVLPATGRNASVNILQENLQLEVNGRKAGITHWKPLPWTAGNLELVARGKFNGLNRGNLRTNMKVEELKGAKKVSFF